MFKTIDLFAGAGGLSFGFEMTGKFKVLAAAEINKKCTSHIQKKYCWRKTYIYND